MHLSFDAIADQFDHQRGLPRSGIRAWVEFVDQLVDGQQLQIIEPGIGTGRVSLPLAALGHEVTGTDISQPMLDTCEDAAGRLHLADRVHLTQADATDLPFDDDSFDLGVIAQLLYLVPDWPAVLDELARVARPGGYVIHLTEPTTEGDALSRWSATWREMIESTGYRHIPPTPDEEEAHAEFLRRWPDVQIRELATWSFDQSVNEAREGYAGRVRPLYASVSEEAFNQTVINFLAWAREAFPDGNSRLDGTVTLTAMIAAS